MKATIRKPTKNPVHWETGTCESCGKNRPLASIDMVGSPWQCKPCWLDGGFILDGTYEEA